MKNEIMKRQVSAQKTRQDLILKAMMESSTTFPSTTGIIRGIICLTTLTKKIDRLVRSGQSIRKQYLHDHSQSSDVTGTQEVRSPLLYALELGQTDIARIIASKYFFYLRPFEQLQDSNSTSASLIEELLIGSHSSRCESREDNIEVLEVFYKQFKHNKQVIENLDWAIRSRVIAVCLSGLRSNWCDSYFGVSRLSDKAVQIYKKLLFDIFIDDVNLSLIHI